MKKNIVFVSICSVLSVVLIIFSILLFQFNDKNKSLNEKLNKIEEEQQITYVNGNPELTEEGTLPGEAYYFLTLTNVESKKNLNYTVNDFQLSDLGLYSVDEVIKTNDYNALYNKNDYRKYLKLLFKNHNDFREIKIRKALNSDTRVESYDKNLDFNFSLGKYGAYFKNLETNLNIKNISWVGRLVEEDNKGYLINDLNTFNELKNKYMNITNKSMISDNNTYINWNIQGVDLSSFEKIKDDYFENNTLIYLNIYGIIADDIILNGFYEKKGKYELDYSNYTLVGSDESMYQTSYLIEIEGKLEEKPFVFNRSSYKGYYSNNELQTKSTLIK